MTRARTDYQRDYMRTYREANPTSQKGRMAKALRDMNERLKGNEKPLAIELRAMIAEALG